MKSILVTILTCYALFPQTSVCIYSGSPARVESEFPFAVQVQKVQRHRPECISTCGGSIVSANIIVTAAHCVRYAEGETCADTAEQDTAVRILAGTNRWEWDVNSKDVGITSQVRMVKHIIVHDEYNDTISPIVFNDIALLVLSYPLTFDQFVSPIRLPTLDQEFQGSGLICGWGRTENGTSSNTLLHAQTQIIPMDECANRLLDNLIKHTVDPEIREALESMRNEYEEDEDDESDTAICIRSNESNGASICKGDSGGPLLCKDNDGHAVLCGIASLIIGDDCGEHEAPQVVTAVANFSDWIQNLITEFNHTCTVTNFNCGDGACIPTSARCNGVVDCTQGTDEINCTPCGKNQFRCISHPKCIDAAYICDGTNDCRDDGSDELGCDECRADQFWCGNGTCIHKSAVCDGVVQCVDNASDEFGCGECIGSEFKCRNGKCVHKESLCHSVEMDPCGDGSNELKLVCENQTSQSKSDVTSMSERCHRGLEFVACMIQGCSFNTQTRECVADADLVEMRKATSNKDKSSRQDYGGNGRNNGGWLTSKKAEIFYGTAIILMGMLLGWCLHCVLGVWTSKRQMKRLRRMTTGPRNKSEVNPDPEQEPMNLQVDAACASEIDHRLQDGEV